MEHRYYGRAEPKRRGRGDQAGGARWWKKTSRQKQKTKKPKARQRKQEAEECKGGPGLSHRRIGRREAESFTVRPEESNSIEHELSAVNWRIERRL